MSFSQTRTHYSSIRFIHSHTLSHVNDSGKANMVDISQKPITARKATATATVHLNDMAYTRLKENNIQKGDVLCVARIAGIQAAKQTHHLIPLCHSLPLNKVSVDFHLNDQEKTVHIQAMAMTESKTGVEMEALVAASVAACTIFDMCKAVDPSIFITQMKVTQKSKE
jgi:cyclic pyranopterin phosphate synthase